MELNDLIKNQTAYFRAGKTKPISARLDALWRLEKSILRYEDDMYAAFRIDLGKSRAEAYMSEISQVLSEIRYIRRNLRLWALPRIKPASLSTFPARSRIFPEPYGVVLILAPWNYPLYLAMSPLAGAIAAGNCVVLKCSKSSPNCSDVIKKIVTFALTPEEAVCVDADTDYDEVLRQNYQYIFFTGSPRVGKTIMKRAAEDLIPVSLELGGKSPCIVTSTADLKRAAKRIAWGKFLNAGQTCISVDYILVDEKVRESLIYFLEDEIKLRYPDASHNQYYPRIITDGHFERLQSLINNAKAAGRHVSGGELNGVERRISPAIIKDASWDDEIMQEEIFGPILPVISYKHLDDAVESINDRPHPLATYIFTEDKKLAKKLINRIPFGGGCVNDTILHIANHNLPFGGVGNSGMGNYHGKYSFRTFSHMKSVLLNTTKVDIPVRYAPFTDRKWRLLRKF